MPFFNDPGSVASSLLAAAVGALPGTVAAIIGFKRYLHERAEVRQLTDQAMESASKISKLEEKLLGAEQERDRVKDALALSEQGRDSLSGDIISCQNEVDGYQKNLNAERRRIERVLGKDGHTWTEKVRSNAPDFRQLQPASRTMPIISVLNLKGGVGKTTITANLAAALDSMGYRVLLLDLDLQGSLTSLFLPESSQEVLFKNQKLLGDFLAASFDAEYPDLREYVQPVLGRSGLVPTTDNLAYAETNLTIRWLLREGNRDPRFLLRKETHLRRITNDYDIVLLDCPPVINVSCVNSLAASDYVLIPIQPSKQATARVPILLQRLKDFLENINSELNVLGIVANRTHKSELTVEEQNRLTALSGQCKDIWGQGIPIFDTFIRQNVEVRAAEDEHRPLTEEDEMFATFVELAKEIEGRIPTFCKPKLQTTEAQVEEAVS